MTRYLQEAGDVEAMTVFYGPAVEPHQHRVWTGDFMGMCVHDIACPVCFDASAIITRDVTPGRFKQQVEPCPACVTKGWRIVRLPKWLLAILAALSITGCSAQPSAPPPEPEFEVVAQTWREGFGTNPMTAALVRETATGCLYSVAEGKGAAPLILPDGKHAGCRP